MTQADATTPDTPPQLKRRWFQYSLLSLLILTAFIAAAMAVWSNSARQQRDAVAAIKQAEGEVRYDFQVRELKAPPHWPKWLVDALGVDFFAEVHVVDLKYNHSASRYEGSPGIAGYRSDTGTLEQMAHIGRLTDLRSLRLGGATTDAGLSHIRGLTALEQLDLASTRVTDSGLEHLDGLAALRRLCLDDVHLTDSGLKHLSRLSKLEQLDISRTRVTNAGLEHLTGMTALKILSLRDLPVTDAGLEKIKGLKSLERLYPSGTQITDAGLEHVRDLTALISLDVSGTRVTDAGLRHLRGLSTLETLTLSDTQVTDAGLEHLRGLTSLKEIHAVDTKITNAGVTRLQQALPNCKIETQLAVLE